MRSLFIGVTGINACDNPAPGMGIVRSLKEQTDIDISIAGLAYDAMEPGIYMEGMVDRSYLIPYPSAGHEALVQRLLYVKHQFGLDVVIPTLDSELPFYIKCRDELASHGIATFLPTDVQFKLRGKDQLDIIAKETGFTAPKQATVFSYEELGKAITEIGLPVMVKGALYNAHAAYTMEEAMGNFSKIVAQWGYPAIVQQMVKGDEMSVIGVGDGKGGTVGLVAMKKMSTTQLGKVWTGVTVLHDKLLERTREFVKNSNWQGAFEIECLVDGDTINLIEINPRFPAWVYFATGVGVNLPLAMVQLALGEKSLNFKSYPAGKLFIRYTGEQICDLEQFQNMVTLGESA
ncbi:MAG: ATP-grasp domain-containing protein [Gammaproteobacteria bacterium]